MMTILKSNRQRLRKMSENAAMRIVLILLWATVFLFVISTYLPNTMTDCEMRGNIQDLTETALH